MLLNQITLWTFKSSILFHKRACGVTIAHTRAGGGCGYSFFSGGWGGGD